MSFFDNVYSLVYEIVETLKEHKLKISTAESCTSGLLAATFTEVPGSSAVYWGGICAYSNQVKIKILNVPEHILAQHGAVSQEVAMIMATNVRQLLNTDIGIAITGIAGPDGGTNEKPVGTIWISIADANNSYTRLFSLHGNRRQIRQSCVENVLLELKDFLSNKFSSNY